MSPEPSLDAKFRGMIFSKVTMGSMHRPGSVVLLQGLAEAWLYLAKGGI
jgi:hypothetical protein